LLDPCGRTAPSMRGYGADEESLRHAMIGVVKQWKGEQTHLQHYPPTSMGRCRQGRGSRRPGGTPREFTTISVSYGISMTLRGMKFRFSRGEVIADRSIETFVLSCLLCIDRFRRLRTRTLSSRLDEECIRCTCRRSSSMAGSRFPGRFGVKTLTVLDSYESVGRFITGEIYEATLAVHRSVLPADDAALRGRVTPPTLWRMCPMRWVLHSPRVDDPRRPMRSARNYPRPGRNVL